MAGSLIGESDRCAVRLWGLSLAGTRGVPQFNFQPPSDTSIRDIAKHAIWSELEA